MNSIKIEIRYLRSFAYGPQCTLILQVDPFCLVSDLKKMIFAQLKLQIQYQDLHIKRYGNWEKMLDDNSLSFYEIQPNQHFLLKSPYYEQILAREQAQGFNTNEKELPNAQKMRVAVEKQQNFNLMRKHFFDKIGLTKNRIQVPSKVGDGQIQENQEYQTQQTQSNNRLVKSNSSSDLQQIVQKSQLNAQDDFLPTFGGSEKVSSLKRPSSQNRAELEDKKQIDERLQEARKDTINEICQMIRQDITEQELVRFLTQYQQEEAKFLNQQSQRALAYRQLHQGQDNIKGQMSENLRPINPQDIQLNLNLLSKDQFTPLHVACQVGNESVAQYLLFKKHVDPNVKGVNDWIPIEVACHNKHPRIVDMLLKIKNTNLNYSSPLRGSCLHLAAKADNFQICQMLLLHNIDLNLVNQAGQKAKDLTNNQQILNIIAWYENNQQKGFGFGQGDNTIGIKKNLNMPKNVISEEEDDDEASSLTVSPSGTDSRLNTLANQSPDYQNLSNIKSSFSNQVDGSLPSKSEMQNTQNIESLQENENGTEQRKLPVQGLKAQIFQGLGASNSVRSSVINSGIQGGNKDGGKSKHMSKIARALRQRGISGESEELKGDASRTAKVLNDKANQTIKNTNNGVQIDGSFTFVTDIDVQHDLKERSQNRQNFQDKNQNLNQISSAQKPNQNDRNTIIEKTNAQEIKIDYLNQTKQEKLNSSNLMKSNISGFSSNSGPDLLDRTGRQTPTLNQSQMSATGKNDQTILGDSGTFGDLLSQDLTLENLYKLDINRVSHLDFIISELLRYQNQKKPYSSFFPISRVKGTVKKVHRTGVANYSRLLYVNPIEGVLISYHSQSKFPHSPSYIIKLNEIKELGVLLEERNSKWFFKRGQYYIIVRSEQKTCYFFTDNLDMIHYWAKEIGAAKKFYTWYQKLTSLRYDKKSNQQLEKKYDYILDFIMQVKLPECDLDNYQPKSGIDIDTFAKSKARSFCEKNKQDLTGLVFTGVLNKEESKTNVGTSDGLNLSANNFVDKTNEISSKALSDHSGQVYEVVNLNHNSQPTIIKPNNVTVAQHHIPVPLNKSQQITEVKEQISEKEQIQEKLRNPQQDFQRELQRMKEMQQRQELAPDEVEKMRMTQAVLIDDSITQGIGFKSFEILDLLGHGAFGKVFKCRRKELDKVYAMKVLKKAFLYRNKHLKYAITECNILKHAEHPFVIKMHYSFQTPDNLYMILDFCPGGDLSYHLNKRQIFEEQEAKFFIAEIVLAIEYIHSLDVIYRDLKPENILIDGDGHCRLADFGLAKENMGEKEFAKSFCGSPAYLPPEMLHSKGVSKSADIYQIGAVLYEFLVGFPPYYTENIKELYNNIRQARLQVPKYISREGKDLLNQLLNKKPEKRITLDKVKQHEFFKDLDWEALERKEISPPIHLKTGDGQDEGEMDEETAFLKKQESKFKDRDYTQENQLQNRLKQFTFIAGQAQRPGPQPPLE